MDIISALSDDLLLRILSFVPTEDVVATSLLSQRWRSLWMLVPKLRYDSNDISGDYKSFSQFVYRSLLSNKAPVLEKLYLSLGPECPVIDSGLWIDVALSHHLRELEIEILLREETVSLPNSLYNSVTLETLILTGYLLVNVPNNAFLPSLKVMHLLYVDYAQDESLRSFLSSCPNLQELVVQLHKGVRRLDFTVVMPSLQRLSLCDITFGGIDEYVIGAPSLKYLHIEDDFFYSSCHIKNMPELVEAHVDISNDVSLGFLRALTSVHRLSLHVPFSKVQLPFGNMIFDKLLHLELYTSARGWWYLFTHILVISPNLRVLKLANKPGLCSKQTTICWKQPSSIPKCLMYSLEAFEWIGYKGRQGDREIATYVLKHAARLKTATFSPGSTVLEEKYRMLKELASVATVSTSSQLLFD